MSPSKRGTPPDGRGGAAPGRQTFHLDRTLGAEVREALARFSDEDGVRRLWSGDAALWTGEDESRWVGWLTIPGEMIAERGLLHDLADEAAGRGFTDAVVLGMGGSSLCPDVLRATFGRAPGFPRLRVLDSTDPAQVRACRDAIDIEHSLFIVSSKSGSTTEPNIFMRYFLDEAGRAAGAGAAARCFIAITDPQSSLEKIAARERFGRVFHGVPSIGGRYSALSHFGMVPAAVMGLDTGRLLEGAAGMARACGAGVPPADNPGVALGIVLGTAARAGRDKLTLILSPGIGAFGAWLEQLIAESTGKKGRGIIPVDRERPPVPGACGDDRLFAYVRLEPAPDAAQDAAVDLLQAAGHPVVRIAVADPYDLGGEFFRWEIATAAAGAVLGINPFDQPDVEASKVATRAITGAYEKTGTLPPETPLLAEGGLRLFTDDRNAGALRAAAGADGSLTDLLRAHLGRIDAGDYLAILAYVAMSAAHEEALAGIRHRVRDARRVATCLGFGPRFLHSTGQAYKGGPDSGVFLQITCDDAADLPVPGQSYTFGVVKAAQARGDFQVLAERGRRALRVHLGPDVKGGLTTLRRAVDRALA